MTPMTPKEFEETVLTLLRLSGYDVNPEPLLKHKKVDVYAEERRLGKVRRLAVECKRYDRPLTQQQVLSIYTNYRPLYDANEIDELLIVTLRGLAPSAVPFVEHGRGITHLTIAELQNAVIDFSVYLNGLVAQFDEDGLSSYYIRPRVNNHELETLTRQWIAKAGRPLAILASYGMGKTSFSRFMAATLAREAIAHADARIPIVVKLAEISAEQSLEGLLGRIFSTTKVVKNYSFDAFMELNRRGRFVIFLDGFDEMKHTLTWDQFRFNFTQLNRLIVGDSRVVLLGRPTAFLSDAEHQYILHGVRRESGVPVRDTNWPDYQEIELQPFTRDEVRRFLIGYTTYLTLSARVATISVDEIVTRIDRLPPSKLADLASRPVQLRILSEVLPQWGGDATELTAEKLYSTFINIVIEREQEKIARRRLIYASDVISHGSWRTGSGPRNHQR